MKEETNERYRKRTAEKYGFPETSSWEDIEYAKLRYEGIIDLNLPQDASVIDVIRAREDEERIVSALNVGLDESATWEEIDAVLKTLKTSKIR